MTNSIASRTSGAGTRSVASLIAAPFKATGTLLIAVASRQAERRAREIRDLNNLTDAELASRGLRRDDIVRHVFRGTGYI